MHSHCSDSSSAAAGRQAQALRIIFLQLPSPIYTPDPQALGMKGNDPVDFSWLPSRIRTNLLYGGISVPDFFL